MSRAPAPFTAASAARALKAWEQVKGEPGTICIQRNGSMIIVPASVYAARPNVANDDQPEPGSNEALDKELAAWMEEHGNV